MPIVITFLYDANLDWDTMNNNSYSNNLEGLCVGFVSGVFLVAGLEATGTAYVRSFEKLPHLQVRPTSGQG